MKKYLIPFLLVILVIVARIPSFIEPHWYDDEEMYLSIGNALSHGSHLYTQITDNKPPLLYWWVSLNPNLSWLKISASIFVSVSTVYLYFIGKKIRFNRQSMITMLTIFVLLTNLPSFEGDIFNAELMFMPFIIVSFYLSWIWLFSPKANKTTLYIHAAYIGIIMGIASLVKIPSITDFGALLLISAATAAKSIKTRLFVVSFLCIGFMIPWICISSYFIVTHSINPFIYNSILYNIKYIHDWTHISQSPLLVFLSPLEFRIALLLSSIGITYVLYIKNKISQTTAISVCWLSASWFGSLLSLRPYPHYLLQLCPPFCLMLGSSINSSRIADRIYMSLMGILLVLFIQYTPFDLYRTKSYYRNWWLYSTHTISLNEYKNWFNGKAVISSEISQYINTYAQPHDSIFVWGNIASIYALTKLIPATPYVTDYLIESYQAYSSVIQRLSHQPPQWIVYCNLSELKFPALNQFINTQYIQDLSSNKCIVYHHLPLQMLQ